MAELAGYGGLLAAADWLYWIVAALVVWWAWRKPITKRNKVLAASLAVAVFLALPAARVYHAASYQWKLSKAKALFEERCKTAGEKIYRTVDGVDGVLLMKVRPDRVNFSDQYAMDDPYGRDVGGEGYIGSFLSPIAGVSLNTRVAEARRSRFRYVEVEDPESKKLFRYTGVIKSVGGRDPNFEIQKVEVLNRSARHGVTYEDISTSEDRESWIAGGLLKVVDLQSNEVIAERRGYIFDPELGNTAGGRGPWEGAISCNSADRGYGHNARFVLRTLKPTNQQ